MQTKKLIPAIAVLVVGGSLLGATTLAFAQTGNTPLSGLAQSIASKFNLNQSDVQNQINSYMQQHKADMQKTMQDRQKARLDALVTQGKITSAQETAILNEFASLQTKYGPSAMQGKTAAEKVQARKDEKTELTAWATSQGINTSYVLPFGMGGMRGHGGWKNNTTPTPTP